MQFKIGSRRYALRITEGPIVSDGVAFLGVCLQASQEILISGDCEPRDRMRVLLCELARAWAFETGKSAPDAGWCSLTATVAMASAIDLNAQGGEMALIGLSPGESPQPGAARVGMSGARICHTCQSTVASGSVACRPGKRPGTIELRIYCEFCNKTQVWSEFMTATGLPNNRAVADAKFERGDTTGLNNRIHSCA